MVEESAMVVRHNLLMMAPATRILEAPLRRSGRPCRALGCLPSLWLDLWPHWPRRGLAWLWVSYDDVVDLSHLPTLAIHGDIESGEGRLFEAYGLLLRPVEGVRELAFG